MPSQEFTQAVRQIRQTDPSYDEAAYFFLKEGLDYTLDNLRTKKIQLEGNHVSGRQLVDGIRRYALEQYGPLARTVLEHWNIRSTRDFGVMVFQLVDLGVLGKTADDSLADFENQYDFEAAFCHPFRPKSLPPGGLPRSLE
jgi:uncharacterized repeat protein (TIGR04138 family)